MAYSRPTLGSLRRDARAAISAVVTGADALLRWSVLRVLADVLAGFTHQVYGYLDWLARQLLPDTAEDNWLDRWARLYGLARKAASAASGTITLTGTAGTVLASGSLLTRSDGAQYATTAEATIGSGGSATVAVQASTAGADGNAEAGTTLALYVAQVGIAGTATVGSAGLSGGAAAETDAALRARLLARMSNPPQGGSQTDYEAWALAVSGVTRAWVYPLNRGAGTVDVAFVMDGRSSIVPLSGDVATVQAYIDERRPVTADCVVFAPVGEALNVTIAGLSPDTSAIRAAIATELADQILRDGAPGGTIRKSRLMEAVSRATGESYHTMTLPAGDVTFAAGHIAIPGTVTFA